MFHSPERAPGDVILSLFPPLWGQGSLCRTGGIDSARGLPALQPEAATGQDIALCLTNDGACTGSGPTGLGECMLPSLLPKAADRLPGKELQVRFQLYFI